jgi:DNA-binding XRE family transcriptional regulator
MFPNLDAEQGRHKMSNQAVANELGMSRKTYELKKKNGNFTRPQIIKLMGMFKCSFEYLFDESTPEPGRETA